MTEVILISLASEMVTTTDNPDHSVTTTGPQFTGAESSPDGTLLPGNSSIAPHSFSLDGIGPEDMTRHPTTSTAKLINQYELIWTPEVVSRVTSIVVVMFLTLVGNSILITLILCHRKLRKKRVNIFLVNLAVGDLMVCLVTMTTEILFVAFGEWVLGGTACKITVYGQIVTLASATFLLTAMSVDRYQVIVRPLQSLTGQPSICRKVVCAWICAFVFATPQLFVFVQTEEGIKMDGTVKHLCRSQGYTAQWQRKVYFTFLTTYILVIPTVIMTFCYVNIIRVVFMRTGREQEVTPKLRFTSSKKQPSSLEIRKSSSDSQNEIEYSLSQGALPNRWNRRRSAHAINRLNIPNKLVSASKRKVVKMTLSVIVAFLFCWSPYFVVGLIRIYSGYQIKLTQVYSVAEILAMLHSALNPILYGMFSTQSAVKILKNICCRKKSNKNICDTSLGSDFESVLLGTNALRPQSRQSSEDSNLDRTCGCIRLIDKVCFYCSQGYKKSRTAGLRKKKTPQTFCHRPGIGNFRGMTESTFVELSRIDSLAVNDIQLRRDEEGNLIYGTFPCRFPPPQNQFGSSERATRSDET